MAHELRRICWSSRDTDEAIDVILDKLIEVYEGQSYWGWEVDYILYADYPGPIDGDEEKTINNWLKSEGAVPGENILIDMNQ